AGGSVQVIRKTALRANLQRLLGVGPRGEEFHRAYLENLGADGGHRGARCGGLRGRRRRERLPRGRRQRRGGWKRRRGGQRRFRRKRRDWWNRRDWRDRGDGRRRAGGEGHLGVPGPAHL